jgi:hypothetical protein
MSPLLSAIKIIEMKIILSSSLIFFFTPFYSCKKKEENAGVLMRVENTTSQNFTEVLSNTESFGRVDASFTTSYKSFEKIVDVPNATIITGSDTVRAGIYYIDFPSYFNMGKYTLQISADSTTYSGYSCRYIKN